MIGEHSRCVVLRINSMFKASADMLRSPKWRRWFYYPLGIIPLLWWIEIYYDLKISAEFFAPESFVFSWREHWLMKDVIHQYGKVPAIGALFVLIFLAYSKSAQKKYSLQTSQVIYAIVAMVSCAAIVYFIKRQSLTACTWDLQSFGGLYPHLTFFGGESFPAGLSPGHCWPGAFSLSGFSLFALYFFCIDIHRDQWARKLFIGVMMYGNALGFIQVMRGAHLFTHQIWTALICWYVCLGLYALLVIVRPYWLERNVMSSKDAQSLT